MRILVLLFALLAASTSAGAQVVYLTEHGNWTVFAGPSKCRALNRPPQEFNYAPYSALQIAVGPKMAISVEVFFWPGAVTTDGTSKLVLLFQSGGDLTLEAEAPMGDFMLTAADPGLWRLFEKSTSLIASLNGKQSLFFGLDGISGVLTSLQTCASYLPKP